MAPVFTSFKTEGVPSLALYFYNEKITSILFQFKGCFDIELAPVFLGRALPLLKAKYRGYTLLPAPSSPSHDERRGFNHVVEMFKGLGLPILQAFRKTEDVKQADLSAKERKKVKKRIAWNKGISIRGKKVLLVDDVYTTGSTMKACLALAKKHRPKKISILVMAKTPPLKRQGKKKGEAG